jgi:anti-anti-sigma factor
MSLQLEERHCGNVYVITCTGRIVAGEEVAALEAAIARGLREFKRLVLRLSTVDRLDSTGMGLLVRFAVHTRSRGGDLRLAEPAPFVGTLLQMTRLASVLRAYVTEEEAIVSFLRERFTDSRDTSPAKRSVLFVDQSADLCAFVRALLAEHGYAVTSTALARDARILLQAARVDFLIFGPDSSQMPRETLVSSLKQLAPQAAVLHLERDFKQRDPHQAGEMLLEMMRK